MSTVRMSPVHARLDALGARFAQRNDMAVALQIDDHDIARADTLALADLSHLHKAGFKGPGAADWVKNLGYPLPKPNGWAALEGEALLARLASSEFFIEAQDRTVVDRVRAALGQPVAGVYPVLRQDAGFALTGDKVNELLVETCNVNFRDPELGRDSVVMSTMVGVSVLVIRRDKAHRPCYRVWCDPTMAPYLWDTLAQIARDLGGGPVGLSALADSPRS